MRKSTHESNFHIHSNDCFFVLITEVNLYDHDYVVFFVARVTNSKKYSQLYRESYQINKRNIPTYDNTHDKLELYLNNHITKKKTTSKCLEDSRKIMNTYLLSLTIENDEIFWVSSFL